MKQIGLIIINGEAQAMEAGESKDLVQRVLVNKAASAIIDGKFPPDLELKFEIAIWSSASKDVTTEVNNAVKSITTLRETIAGIGKEVGDDSPAMDGGGEVSEPMHTNGNGERDKQSTDFRKYVEARMEEREQERRQQGKPLIILTDK